MINVTPKMHTHLLLQPQHEFFSSLESIDTVEPNEEASILLRCGDVRFMLPALEILVVVKTLSYFSSFTDTKGRDLGLGQDPGLLETRETLTQLEELDTRVVTWWEEWTLVWCSHLAGVDARVVHSHLADGVDARVVHSHLAGGVSTFPPVAGCGVALWGRFYTKADYTRPDTPIAPPSPSYRQGPS